MVSSGTILCTAGAGLAVNCVITILIEDTVVICLLDGEVVAILVLLALQDTFFKVGLSVQGYQMRYD